MATRLTATEKQLLTESQREDILRVTDRRGMISLTTQIPTDLPTRKAHRAYFCKNAYITAAKYIDVLPQDYQEALLDYVLRNNALSDIYFGYKEKFFLKCLARLFSKTKFQKRRFIDEMFLFLSDESTVELIKEAEKLTTDAKAIKRMEKVRKSYFILTDSDEDSEEDEE